MLQELLSESVQATIYYFGSLKAPFAVTFAVLIRSCVTLSEVGFVSPPSNISVLGLTRFAVAERLQRGRSGSTKVETREARCSGNQEIYLLLYKGLQHTDLLGVQPEDAQVFMVCPEGGGGGEGEGV